ncbi:hypothetical protein MASR2M12_15550 [Bacteroidales bacterium]
MDEHQLEELLKSMKPARAPQGMKEGIMEQIGRLPLNAPTARRGLLAESFLLWMSLLAILLFCGWAWQTGLLGAEMPWIQFLRQSMGNIFTRFSGMAGRPSVYGISILLSLGLLLLLDRMINNKPHTRLNLL